MYKHIVTDSQISEAEFLQLPPTDQLDYKKIEEQEKSDEGNLTMMSDGHLGLNIGSGLSIDLSDGHLGLNLGGGFSLKL